MKKIRVQVELRALLPLGFKIANSCMSWRKTLNSSHTPGNGQKTVETLRAS